MKCLAFQSDFLQTDTFFPKCTNLKYSTFCQMFFYTMLVNGLHIMVILLLLINPFISVSICTELTAEHRIYFFFRREGNPKTVLQGGYSGWHCKLPALLAGRFGIPMAIGIGLSVSPRELGIGCVTFSCPDSYRDTYK